MPKATIITSNIQSLLESFKHDGKSLKENIALQKSPVLTKIGEVVIYKEISKEGVFQTVPVMETLFRLEYGDKVVLEKIVRNPDEDGIDYLISETYNKENQPKEWLIEDTGEYDDISDEVEAFNRDNPELVNLASE